MASLTPGVLSKLIENAGNKNFKVTGQHRSPLLQVLEIVPSLPGAGDDDQNDPFRTRGFFLKLSDSLHSAYASISDDDLDLIYSDKIQLGQFVHVSRFDPAVSGSRIPVLRGLKPVSRRKPCVGNPTDLVSSDALPISRAAVLPRRRLSLDSVRRGWDRGFSPPASAVKAAGSPPGRASSEVGSAKALKFSPLKTKDQSSLVPKLTSTVKRKDVKSPAEIRPVPVAVDLKSVSEKNIAWRSLPSTVAVAGKKAVRGRNLAFMAAVDALEEAAAIETLLHSMCLFGELCETSKQVCSGKLTDQFLQLYQRIQEAHSTLNSLLNKMPSPNSNLHNNSNATSWIQAAVATNLSAFDLFESKDHNKLETQSQNKKLYVVIDDATNKLNLPTPTNCKSCPSNSSAKLTHSSKKEDWCKRNSLKEAVELANDLLLVSRRWFVKYLEDLLGNGFGLRVKEESPDDIAYLLRQLKKVNEWMNEFIESKVEIDDKMEQLKKKLYKFLLDHVDIATRSR
ncbi:hypothetical protein IC575_002724 [Cucumis melo]|uniref:Uncharacterized protein LOC103499875 n=1 Tax=Cucumis melo TaxID=3656 RepID=A0A1S3CDR5_CUCME|nr:uncharacterized protein LOC103499875 [Cucumis melo]